MSDTPHRDVVFTTCELLLRQEGRRVDFELIATPAFLKALRDELTNFPHCASIPEQSRLELMNTPYGAVHFKTMPGLVGNAMFVRAVQTEEDAINESIRNDRLMGRHTP